MSHLKRIGYALIGALLWLMSAMQSHAQERVGVALVLLIDVSLSVDENEYALQKDGIVSAFMNPAVVKAIWNQYGIAVTVIEWSDRQTVTVPWMIVNDKESAARFAGVLHATERTEAEWTGLGDALVAGIAAFNTCPCIPSKLVIDVSGDGPSNHGEANVETTRDLAVDQGITINGLAVLDPTAEPYKNNELIAHYRNAVTGGDGSFVIVASSYDDFARAIRQKLTLEIAGVMP